jgi:hypothetical protein
MTKAEIIDKTLRESGLKSVSEGVVAELHRRLPDGVDIKTCEDFRHFNVECCDTCHHFCPETEMNVIELPDGGKAWVCDQIEWTIYPERRKELEEWENSPEGRAIIGLAGASQT